MQTRRYPSKVRSLTKPFWEKVARSGNAAAAAAPQDPSTSDSPTLKEALSSPEASIWNTAIQKESLEHARCWELVQKPVGAKLFSSEVILKGKRDKNGTPARCKARKVLLGNLETLGADFDQTYALFVGFSVIRAALSLAARERMCWREKGFRSVFYYLSSARHSPSCL